MNYLYICIFLVLGTSMGVGALLMSKLIAPSRPNERKGTPYECGEKIIGPAWVQFNVGYYLFVLLFLVFDVETVFLYPCAMIIKEVGILALAEVGIFVSLLTLGLVYAWRKGVLEWV